MPRVEDIEIPIGGMTCAACARTVEKQLSGSKGVTGASVNFATRTASVRFDPNQTQLEDLVHAVEDVGYEVPAAPQEIAEAAEARELRKRLIVGAVFAVPVFVLGMLERLPLIQFILTLPVLFYAGPRILSRCLDRPAPRFRQHEHADRARYRRGVSLFTL